ncbi:MAG: hypothetical protein ACOX4O_01930 [Eubacteriales bacterium]
MKPASIIFLIVSVVVIAAGLGLCFTSAGMAEKQGILLFEAERLTDGDIRQTIDFTDLELNRISLNVTEAVVNISRGEKSYCEIINFPAGTYSANLTAQSFTLDDSLNIFSIMNFAESGFEFKGIRQYMQYYNRSGFLHRQKEVNIYIAFSDKINVIDINGTESKLNISNINAKTDYRIDMMHGSVNIDNVSTSSTMTISASESDIIIKSRSIKECSVEASNSTIGVVLVNPDTQSFDIMVDGGEIEYLGTSLESEYKTEIPISTVKMRIRLTGGKISVYEWNLQEEK